MNNLETFLTKFPVVLDDEMRMNFDPISMTLIIREKVDSVHWLMKWNMGGRDFKIGGMIYNVAIEDLALLMKDYVKEFVKDILHNITDAMNEAEGKKRWSYNA